MSTSSDAVDTGTQVRAFDVAMPVPVGKDSGSDEKEPLLILVVQLSNPKKLNAIDESGFHRLAQAFGSVRPDHCAVVLCADPKSPFFTSGASMAGGVLPDDAGDTGAFALAKSLADLTVPLVVVVHGPAVGAGLTILPWADLVFASVAATFQAPFREIAIVPELASSCMFPRLLVS